MYTHWKQQLEHGYLRKAHTMFKRVIVIKKLLVYWQDWTICYLCTYHIQGCSQIDDAIVISKLKKNFLQDYCSLHVHVHVHVHANVCCNTQSQLYYPTCTSIFLCLFGCHRYDIVQTRRLGRQNTKKPNTSTYKSQANSQDFKWALESHFTLKDSCYNITVLQVKTNKQELLLETNCCKWALNGVSTLCPCGLGLMLCSKATALALQWFIGSLLWANASTWLRPAALSSRAGKALMKHMESAEHGTYMFIYILHIQANL
jgi:hypothetical protein